MQRKDKEQNKEFALEVIRECEYGTLATVNSDGSAYCIPISPVLYKNNIYFHCAHKGKKLDNINLSNNVCLSCVSYTKLVPEKFTVEYKSAVVEGKCKLVEDEAEKITALRVICEKYAKTNMDEFGNQIAKLMHLTSVFKIEIKKITGKGSK